MELVVIFLWPNLYRFGRLIIMVLNQIQKGAFVLFSCSTTTKKLFILSVNNVFCYFPNSVVLQENQWMNKKNLDMPKLEIQDGIKHFLS